MTIHASLRHAWPHACAERKTSAADAVRSASEVGLGDLRRLRFSRQEADEIARLANNDLKLEAVDFEPPENSRRVLSWASIASFTSQRTDLINNTHPELSGIVLSLVDEKGHPQNGFLRLYDLYNLKLSADLVVLSACQTALGKEIQRRRSRRTDARIYVRRCAARGRKSLADRRSRHSRVYETLLRRDARTKASPRRRTPCRASLDVNKTNAGTNLITGPPSPFRANGNKPQRNPETTTVRLLCVICGLLSANCSCASPRRKLPFVIL